MTSGKTSGQGQFVFDHREELSNLPPAAREFEVALHGGFAVDNREGYGQIYYGMPGCGIMRVDADLQKQEIIGLPDELRPVNFHGAKISDIGGDRRLIMPANNDEMVVVLTLDGEIDFTLPRPVFDDYQAEEAGYKPTDVVLVGDQLYIADGYASNYITSADVNTRQWTGIFGGKTLDPEEDGKFATAHGIDLNPIHSHLDIADRPSSRIQVHGGDGGFLASHKLPAGSFPCGLRYFEYQGRWHTVIGCLRDDPDELRPAPIFIIDSETYEVLSTIRPKEELGIELAEHLHNVVVHIHEGQLYLVCQAWNPGHYFVLQQV